METKGSCLFPHSPLDCAQSSRTCYSALLNVSVPIEYRVLLLTLSGRVLEESCGCAFATVAGNISVFGPDIPRHALDRSQNCLSGSERPTEPGPVLALFALPSTHHFELVSNGPAADQMQLIWCHAFPSDTNKIAPDSCLKQGSESVEHATSPVVPKIAKSQYAKNHAARRTRIRIAHVTIVSRGIPTRRRRPSWQID